MNITTPIDDSADARATALDGAARLIEGRLPALLIDVDAHAVVLANSSAGKALEFNTPFPLLLDRAMPAWAAISACVNTVNSGNARPALLLWWTPAGPRVFDATLDALPYGGRTLVRVVLQTRPIDQQQKSVEANPAAAGPSIDVARTQADDLATLREIARRIRAGTGAPPPAPVPTASVIAPMRPPPLDFRPLGSPSNDTVPANGHSTAAADTRPDNTLAKLAHELRTPLSAIVSLAEIMRDERLGAMANARYKSYAADIHDSANHTLDLIRTMLERDHRHQDAPDRPGQPRLDLGIVDLYEVAGRCVSAMQPIATRGGIALTLLPATNLPPLLADRRALRQIILNILSNALRFTPTGGTIVVSIAVAANGGMAMSVADTGPGMAAAEIAHALSASTADAAPRRIRLDGAHAGFGFGLPLVRELAEAHGGGIAIESTPGQGTRVLITFPADRVLGICDSGQ